MPATGKGKRAFTKDQNTTIMQVATGTRSSKRVKKSHPPPNRQVAAISQDDAMLSDEESVLSDKSTSSEATGGGSVASKETLTSSKQSNNTKKKGGNEAGKSSKTNKVPVGKENDAPAAENITGGRKVAQAKTAGKAAAASSKTGTSTNGRQLVPKQVAKTSGAGAKTLQDDGSLKTLILCALDSLPEQARELLKASNANENLIKGIPNFKSEKKNASKKLPHSRCYTMVLLRLAVECPSMLQLPTLRERLCAYTTIGKAKYADSRLTLRASTGRMDTNDKSRLFRSTFERELVAYIMKSEYRMNKKCFGILKKATMVVGAIPNLLVGDIDKTKKKNLRELFLQAQKFLEDLVALFDQDKEQLDQSTDSGDCLRLLYDGQAETVPSMGDQLFSFMVMSGRSHMMWSPEVVDKLEKVYAEDFDEDAELEDLGESLEDIYQKSMKKPKAYDTLNELLVCANRSLNVWVSTWALNPARRDEMGENLNRIDDLTEEFKDALLVDTNFSSFKIKEDTPLHFILGSLKSMRKTDATSDNEDEGEEEDKGQEEDDEFSFSNDGKPTYNDDDDAFPTGNDDDDGEDGAPEEEEEEEFATGNDEEEAGVGANAEEGSPTGNENEDDDDDDESEFAAELLATKQGLVRQYEKEAAAIQKKLALAKKDMKKWEKQVGKGSRLG